MKLVTKSQNRSNLSKMLFRETYVKFFKRQGRKISAEIICAGSEGKGWEFLRLRIVAVRLFRQ